MHPYALFPLVTLFVAVSLGSAALYRDPDRPWSRPLAAIFACIACWAGTDVLSVLNQDVGLALWIDRVASVPILLLGPCCVLVIGTLRPVFSDWTPRFFRHSLGLALAVGGLFVFWPALIHKVEKTAWGTWNPTYGIEALLVLPIAIVVPMAAAVRVYRLRDTLEPDEVVTGAPDSHSRSILMRLSGCMVVAAALCPGVELVLPFLGVAVPPIGSFGVLALAGYVYLDAFREDELAMTAQGVARRILEVLPEGVALVDRDGWLRATNAAFARMIEADAQMLVDRRVTELIDLPQAQLEAEVCDQEATLHACTGTERPVSVSTARIGDRQGDELGQVIVVRDLRDVVALRSQIVASGRLAAIGELAAGIAHEVNNPIAFIQADLNLLREHHELVRETVEKHGLSDGLVEALEQVPRCIDESLECVGRVGSIVRDVRSFAHAGSSERTTLDLNELLESALHLATLRMPDGVRVVRTLGEGPRVLCEGQDIKQVCLNLARAVIERAEADSVVLIETEPLRGGICAGFVFRAREGARDELSRALDTSRTPGLVAQAPIPELAVSVHIVADHGGSLGVEQGADGATRVWLWLPRAAPEPGDAM